jgi:AAA+ superfamily predicted ATPase
VVITREEGRVEPYLFEAAAAANYTTTTWDVAQGLADISGKITGPDQQDPGTALNTIRARATGEQRGERTMWIMRDLLPWLSGPGGAAPLRQLRNLARLLPGVAPDRAQAIVILSAGGDLPPELAAHATVIDWPLPDRSEIAALLDTAVQSLPADVKAGALKNGSRDAAIDAAVGLTGEEASSCYAKSLVQLRRVDPKAVAQEKKRVISRERVLEWHDPLEGGLDWVGGLETLKAWLKSRAAAYSPEARAYGVPAPKGTFIFGVSGCGKSLLCKAIATAWGIPLIRFDVGALKSKYVGESEQNIRKAFKIIEAMGRCVVWFDEIEKALQGATSGSADGGVSADALGAILTWMQERQGESFVIATANDVSQLPPEFLRKGRWDELWFVDLPNDVERVAIVEAALRQYKRDPKKIDVNATLVAAATKGFTGAEIAALVPDAMFVAFNDKAREIGTIDLLNAAEAAKDSILSKTAERKINVLRQEWAGRAKPASATPRPAEKVAPARVLDIA